MQQLEFAADSVLFGFGHRYKDLGRWIFYHRSALNYANVIACDELTAPNPWNFHAFKVRKTSYHDTIANRMCFENLTGGD